MKSRLSIFIITYNRAEHLRSTLMGYVNGPFNKYNLFVIDNASTDETEGVVKDFRAAHKNIHYFRNLQNAGPTFSYLTALRSAGTEYVWVIADDDQIDWYSLGDVEDVITRGYYDLIAVGADCHKSNIRGADSVLGMDIKYFIRDCTFMPSMIWRTELVQKATKINTKHYLPQTEILLSLPKDTTVYFSSHVVIVRGTNRGFPTKDYIDSWNYCYSTASEHVRSVMQKEHTKFEWFMFHLGSLLLDRLHFPLWLHKLLTGRTTDKNR